MWNSISMRKKKKKEECETTDVNPAASHVQEDMCDKSGSSELWIRLALTSLYWISHGPNVGLLKALAGCRWSHEKDQTVCPLNNKNIQFSLPLCAFKFFKKTILFMFYILCSLIIEALFIISGLFVVECHGTHKQTGKNLWDSSIVMSLNLFLTVE